MDFGYLGCAVFLILGIVSLNDHNKKLESMFPDNNNDFHRRAKMELHVSLYVFYLLLFALIALFIRSCL